MRLLLDTQSIIWYVDQDHLLSRLDHEGHQRSWPRDPADHR